MFSKLLAPHRSKKNLRIDDLVHLASEVIPRAAGRQDRYKVTAIPDARTLRYYIQEGLVDRPHGTTGPSALYGYRHLLQLVAVKILQTHYLPIRKIKEMMQGLDTPALEERLQAWGASIGPESMGSGPSKPIALEPPSEEPGSTPRTVAAKDNRQPPLSRLGRVSGSAEPPWIPRLQMRARARPEEPAGPAKEPEHLVDSLMERSMQMHTSARQQDPGSGWSRLELHPGIELHVRHGIDLPQSPSFFSALASRLRVILQQLVRPGTD